MFNENFGWLENLTKFALHSYCVLKCSLCWFCCIKLWLHHSVSFLNSTYSITEDLVRSGQVIDFLPMGGMRRSCLLQRLVLLQSTHKHLLHLFEVLLLLFACFFPLQLHHLLQVDVLFKGSTVARLCLSQTLHAQSLNLLIILVPQQLYLVLVVKFLLLLTLFELSFFCSKGLFINFAWLLLQRLSEIGYRLVSLFELFGEVSRLLFKHKNLLL